MNKQGILLIISGPSGSGKGTIVERLCEKNNFSLSISATTRKPREYEKDAAIGVAIGPGTTAFTRIFFSNNSTASEETAISRAPFVAA